MVIRRMTLTTRQGEGSVDFVIISYEYKYMHAYRSVVCCSDIKYRFNAESTASCRAKQMSVKLTLEQGTLATQRCG